MDIPIIFLAILIALIFLFLGYKLGQVLTAHQKEKEWQQREKNARKDAVERSRSVLTGHFSEQLAPYLPDFKYSPTEVRFIGKPIDFLVFKGMDEKNIEEVVFVEVKSGKSQLSTHERKLRDVIKAGKVRWEEYRAKQ